MPSDQARIALPEGWVARSGAAIPSAPDASRSAPRPTAAYRIEVAAGDDAGFASLGWPSNRDRRDGYVFQSREFLTLWRETIGRVRKADLRLVRVRRSDGALVMLVPLAIERSHGARVLRMPDGGVADANAPIVGPAGDLDAAAFRAVWRDVLAALGPVDLVDIPKMPALVRDRANPMLALEHRQAAHSGNLIAIDGASFEAYASDEARRGELGKIERRRRQMARMGETAFTIAKTPAEALALFEPMVVWKRRQFLRTYGVDNFEKSGQLAFYREALAPGRLNTLAEIGGERCGEAVTAALFGFLEPDRFSYVLSAYDLEAYGKFSPGGRVLVHMIQRAFARGQATFDLGEGNLPYKDIWATMRLPLVEHDAALTLRGWLFLMARKMARTLKRRTKARSSAKTA